MDRAAARQIARWMAERHRGKTHDQLRERIGKGSEHDEIALAGVQYQVSFRVEWDDAPEGLIRVWIAVDDGGIRALFPATFCDLVPPGGVFSASFDD